VRDLQHLFEKNIGWADKIKKKHPTFFEELSRQQSPEYLWIGCSDSRVPANEIVDLKPGDIFVHRNVANIVMHADLNCLSVIQYAVEVLKVKHIIVCGHYGCGGIKAAYEDNKLGLIDNWLRSVQDVAQKHPSFLANKNNDLENINTLCELNVIEQVVNVCQTTIVQNAWLNQFDLTVHGWIYGLSDGLLHDLNISISASEKIGEIYRSTIQAMKK